MGIKKYVANADNTIVNTYKLDLKTRATGANAGAADILEAYSMWARVSPSSSGATGSSELSRVLVKFPDGDISSDRSNGIIPASGSVSFYLKMYNAEHSQTVPASYVLSVVAVSQSWEEGVGLDLESYADETKERSGSNWMRASKAAAWVQPGGTYHTSSLAGPGRSSDLGIIYSKSFATGLEDLELDITGLVEMWLTGNVSNYGVGIHMSKSYEAYVSGTYSDGVQTYASGSTPNNIDGSKRSYYTKRFFARGTQYFFKKPVIEARWDSSTKDDRGNFYYSSSLAPGADNLNTIYLYNYVRGKLTNIPGIDTDGSGKILVSLYSGSVDDSEPSGSKIALSVGGGGASAGDYNATGGYVSTGIYSCSMAATAASTPLTTLYDVWHGAGSLRGTQYSTGSIKPKTLKGGQTVAKPTYYMNITNLRNKYRANETARFNLYARQKDWTPNIYTVASQTPLNTCITSASYRVYRLLDAYQAVPYGTGSDLHTRLSYDVSGNYFDFDMKLLQSGYAYAFKFSFYDSALRTWVEQSETFKFRVEDYEY
jgi:hypothetical protein|tara:strand:- start:2011 stop:3636 length:1626 start_codon:yes stop_codon:yes gene_type:complete